MTVGSLRIWLYARMYGGKNSCTITKVSVAIAKMNAGQDPRMNQLQWYHTAKDMEMRKHQVEYPDASVHMEAHSPSSASHIIPPPLGPQKPPHGDVHRGHVVVKVYLDESLSCEIAKQPNRYKIKMKGYGFGCHRQHGTTTQGAYIFHLESNVVYDQKHQYIIMGFDLQKLSEHATIQTVFIGDFEVLDMHNSGRNVALPHLWLQWCTSDPFGKGGGGLSVPWSAAHVVKTKTSHGHDVVKIQPDHGYVCAAGMECAPVYNAAEGLEVHVLLQKCSVRSEHGRHYTIVGRVTGIRGKLVPYNSCPYWPYLWCCDKRICPTICSRGTHQRQRHKGKHGRWSGGMAGHKQRVRQHKGPAWAHKQKKMPTWAWIWIALGVVVVLLIIAVIWMALAQSNGTKYYRVQPGSLDARLNKLLDDIIDHK